MSKKTVTSFQKLKNNNEKISMLTAYDYSTAQVLDKAEIDGILVGDSLAMVALGYDGKLSVNCGATSISFSVGTTLRSVGWPLSIVHLAVLPVSV